jgi:phosphonate transport system substrate-binding protein
MIRNGTIKPDSNHVIWESAPLPNEVVAVRKGLPDDLARRLQDAFASITAEPVAKQLPYPYTGYVAGTDGPYEMLEKMGYDLGALKKKG